MKNLFGLMAIALVISFASCGEAVDKAKEVASDAAEATTDAVSSVGDAIADLVGDKYSVDTEASSITWTGSKKVGDSHSGTVALSSGTVAVDKGDISGGVFTIDIATLANTDMAGTDKAGKLIGHLQSADFFNIESFPTAKFNITKITKVMNNETMTHTVTGDLTLMGTTQSVSMPATVSIDGDKVMATVKDFKLNRTLWGMKYGSGLLGAAADKIINDDVVIGLSLVANK